MTDEVTDTEKQERLSLLTDWSIVKAKLSEFKTKEAALRAQVFSRFFGVGKEGIQREDLPHDYRLKGTSNYNYTVDKDVLSAIRGGEQCKHIDFNSVIRWKPELVKAEFNKLSKEDQQLVLQCVTIKPGSKALEIEGPPKRKAKK